ncbi:hypothetical protein [Rivibacter subsaxonicus]|uniref:Uncharacterized protein n=1 Tax=Rivibacter subsaxonicus TaxID=457575 RepID=A0A4Q7V9U5_9BURK|nr:hypothetical protein [Rivibacter subsaxonicus]RZT91418.1 hypothetical protein EV670_3688 [Rivibacter subsaxonicus]
MSRRGLQRLEILNWVLIYGGMVVAMIGLFVDANDESLSHWLLLIGGLVFAAGLGGIFLRAWLEREDPAAARRMGRGKP